MESVRSAFTKRLGLLAMVVVCLAVFYEFRHASALGVPTLTPLAYSGSLNTFGSPDNGTHTMTVALFVTGANDGGLGSSACSFSTQVTCVNGQFTIPLSSSCVSVVQANPNVQVEVIIDNTPMGLVNISAVPYAIEAGTAAVAANANTLNGLTANGGTNSATDLVALITAAECRGRGGTWTDGSGCTEFVTIGCTSCTWTAALSSCPSNRHLCTMSDMWLGGFRSIDGQGMRSTAPNSYAWTTGHIDGAGNNQIFYPWSTGPFTCASGTAPMWWITKGGSADGCYTQSYTGGFAPCCLN